MLLRVAKSRKLWKAIIAHRPEVFGDIKADEHAVKKLP